MSQKFYYTDVVYSKEDNDLNFKVRLIDHVTHEQIIASITIDIDVEKLLRENLGKKII